MNTADEFSPKHWPNVRRWDDVRTFTGDGFERPDVIAGGFPCQDISNAGKRAGIDGARSGLWSRVRPDHSRGTTAIRPRGERGSVACRTALEEWSEHGRVRVRRGMGLHFGGGRGCAAPSGEGFHFGPRQQRETTRTGDSARTCRSTGCSDGPSGRLQPWPIRLSRRVYDRHSAATDAQRNDQWSIEPDVGRVADGVPAGLEFLGRGRVENKATIRKRTQHRLTCWGN